MELRLCLSQYLRSVVPATSLSVLSYLLERRCSAESFRQVSPLARKATLKRHTTRSAMRDA
eukprot:2271424-Prorocentrum_lima.AAC.1